MTRRIKLFLCSLALLTFVCFFADTGGQARMMKYKAADNPPVHVKQIVAIPDASSTFGGIDAVWSFSCTDIWIQGPNETPSVNEQFPQVTQHYDGSKWISYLPTGIADGQIVSNSLTNTWAIGGGDIGDHGHPINVVYLDHFDGHGWKNVLSSDPNHLRIGAMTIKGNDFWYLAVSNDQGYQVSIHHYSPLSGWNDIPSDGLPAINDSEKMSVLSSINMWIATGSGKLFHYNGIKWSGVPIQPLSLIFDLSVISSNDAWISGTALSGAAITEHWNGKAWQTVPLAFYPSPRPLQQGYVDEARQVFAFSSTDVWTLIAVYTPGDPPTIIPEHWDGSKWTLYTMPPYLSQYGISPLWKLHALGAVTGNSTSQEVVALTP